MKKKFLAIISAICCLSASLFVFVSCGDNDGDAGENGGQTPPPAQHLYHTWETEWKNDDLRHWHKCEECDEKNDYAPHNFVNHVCECGKINPYSVLYTAIDTDAEENEFCLVDSLKSCYNNTLMIPAYDVSYIVIDTNAFHDCTEFTKAVLPDSVKTIGEGAFSGCTELTEISLPASLTEIGNNIFRGCTALTSVNFQGTKAQWNALTQNADEWNSGSSLVKIVCTDGEIPL